jgi:nicotinate-nucleotide adenylyltransferase
VIKKSIGILGGTFDPVHNGHVQLAQKVREHFHFDEVGLLPCNIPAHKPQPIASAQQRADMVALAVQNQPGLVLDDREIHRPGPSYMVDTLRSIREEVGTDYAVSLVLGMDAFLSLPTWHKWQEVIAMSHLVVMARVMWGKPVTGVLADLVEHRGTKEVNDLSSTSAGRVCFYADSVMNVSASEIRRKIREQRTVRDLLPEPVWDYIRTHGLYL